MQSRPALRCVSLQTSLCLCATWIPCARHERAAVPDLLRRCRHAGDRALCEGFDPDLSVYRVLFQRWKRPYLLSYLKSTLFNDIQLNISLVHLFSSSAAFLATPA